MSTSTIDRTLPTELADLARLAITSGLDKTALLFQGLGADFPASIGWQLSLTRTDPAFLIGKALDESDLQGDDLLDIDRPADPEREAKLAELRESVHEGNHLTVTAQIGSEVDAYVGGDDEYWDVKQIRKWILAERPVLDMSPEASMQLSRDAGWMIDAWNRGWSAIRTIDRSQAEALAHVTGRETTEADLYASFEFSALNHFFNVEGHPEHRSAGTEVSYEIRLTRAGLNGPWIYCSDGLVPGTYSPRRMPIDDAMSTIAGVPPWHTEVAYFDEDADDGDGGWVL